MHREHLDAMREATALTRAGRLAEATALIQRTLGGAAPVRVVPGEIVIDEERLRDDHPPGAPPGREDRRASTAAPRRTSPGLGARPGGCGSCCAGSWPRSPTVCGRTCRRPRPARSVPALPGTTLHAVHRGAAGARPYTLYVPTTGTGPRPLVVMLHGGTQTADDFAAATRHERAGAGARVPRRLPRAGHVRQPDAVLELVRARRPAPRCRGAVDPRRDRGRDRGGARGRPRPGVRRRVLGRCGDGRGAGGRVPGRVRRRRACTRGCRRAPPPTSRRASPPCARRRGCGRWTGRCP